MTEMQEPIDVRSVQDRVYSRIREAMRKGVFTWGQTLTIRALAARFGTSETPVREAIKRLVAEKALVQQVDRTFRVPAMTSKTFDELLLARSMIEGRAAEIATPRINAKLMRQLHTTNQEMENALSERNLMLVLEKNEEFHFHLYEASGNSTLIELIEILWLRSGPYLAALAADEAGANAYLDAIGNHTDILAALESRNATETAKALQRDMETTADWFRSRLPWIWETETNPDSSSADPGTLASASPRIAKPKQAKLKLGLA